MSVETKRARPYCHGCETMQPNQQAHTCLTVDVGEKKEEPVATPADDTIWVHPKQHFGTAFGGTAFGGDGEDIEMEDWSGCPGDGSCLTLCDSKGEHSGCVLLIGKPGDMMSAYCNTFSGCNKTTCCLVPCRRCGTGHPQWFIEANEGVCTICS